MPSLVLRSDGALLSGTGKGSGRPAGSVALRSSPARKANRASMFGDVTVRAFLRVKRKVGLL